ncbi:hypothetical protein H8356DRAFT_1325212 [Neocallimastix lanati (nom. inval.)]|nr:hypothetical protein H8356DRAFT_1326621 [Neocallimastix sp. JGI-2020a]KAG4083288.1 hypothetical protein H8356DRAFT_1325212 [Neocallimastix sp. JGI-2020a]
MQYLIFVLGNIVFAALDILHNHPEMEYVIEFKKHSIPFEFEYYKTNRGENFMKFKKF